MTSFLFDADLNVVGEPDDLDWPVAVVAELRACVQRALADGANRFAVHDDVATWRIVPVGKDARWLTVFLEIPVRDGEGSSK